MINVYKLLNVKTIVTLALTLCFIVLSFMGKITNDFMTVYITVIAFYFGTQKQKTEDNKNDK